MGIYGDYLKQFAGADINALTAERKKQLNRISQIRQRDVLVYASDINKQIPPISIDYSDILPIADLLPELKSKKLDLIIETPGGSGEVVEDIARQLHSHFDEIAVIVPGWAKSAGTLLALAADEILMGPSSALGPIDAQLFWQGKRFSAEALLEGLKKIRKEVQDTGTLNKAYIPMLQQISPGEVQGAENALAFAKTLAEDWLVKYKFKNWAEHQTDPTKKGKLVTEEEKRQRARQVAETLGDHNKWLSHGRSIKMDDLKEMRVLVTDYTVIPELADAITRYHVLLHMSFQGNMYKIFETTSSQTMRMLAQQLMIPPGFPMPIPSAPPSRPAGSPSRPPLAQPGQVQAARGKFALKCSACGKSHLLQFNFGQKQPIEPDSEPFPLDNELTCTCGVKHNLSQLRQQIEAQTGQKMV